MFTPTFRFNLNIFSRFIFSFTVLLLLFLVGTVNAQNKTNSSSNKDPMGKPDVWKKLKDNPNNQALWEDYLGKQIQNFTEEDNDKVATWQGQLMVLQAQYAEVVVTSKANTDAADEDILRDMQIGDWENLEKIVMGTGSEIENIRQNIETNFILLEDLYEQSFEEQGLKYVFYDVTYPEGKYSKIAWVEAQEEKLREAKEKELQVLRKQVEKN